MANNTELAEDLGVVEAEEAPVPQVGWQDVNILASSGDKQANRMFYQNRSFSDSGYEIASNNNDYVSTDNPTLRWQWRENEPSQAFRLFKMNNIGSLEYTPWIPCYDSGYQECERQAMRAYLNLLQSGKLPKVNNRGELVTK